MTAVHDEQARGRLDRLRASAPGAEAAFTEPWELRALALAAAAHEAGHFSWGEFQAALVTAVRGWETAPDPAPWRYYERWLEALEALLGRSGVLSDADLDGRTQAVLTTPPPPDHAHPPHRGPIAVDPPGP